MKKKQHSMTDSPVIPLILRLSVPSALGLLVVSAYSLADSFFVAALGKEASAAVGLTFSLHVLMQAVGYTLGMGAGTHLSRALGKGDEREADRYASLALSISFLMGVLITVSGLCLRTPILSMLGASEALLPTAIAYVTPLLFAAPAMCTSFVLSQLLRSEGRAVASMLGLAIGSLFNIALDPLLITVAGLGVQGASIATLISQTLGATFLFTVFRRTRREESLNEGVKEAAVRLGRILIAGLPSLFRQGLLGLSTVLLSRVAAQTGGESAVTALSLVTRLFLLVFSLCLGIGQGMLPVVGYNDGAGRVDRMKRAYLFSTIFSSALMLFCALPICIAAPAILRLLTHDTDAVSIGALALRAQGAVLVTHGTVTCTILFLQAVGKNFLGTLLAAARQGIFFLPLIAILPTTFGINGLSLTQPIADAFTLLFALPFVWICLNYLKKKEDSARSLRTSRGKAS